jgi:hypothetical protein
MVGLALGHSPKDHDLALGSVITAIVMALMTT